MLSRILGIIWIISGLLWLIKPETLRNMLGRKIKRKTIWVVFSFILMFGLLLTGSVIRVYGLLPKIIGITGMVLAIRAIMIITSRTSEKFSDWWAARPVAYFRMWALFILGMGIMLMFVKQG